MSNLMKLAIPLISKSITLDDIKKSTGFINAYFSDINKPYLDNHVFLIYDCSNTKEAFEVKKKLQNIPEFYGKRLEYIKNKPYMIYCFISNPAINRLQDGIISLNQIDKLRVLQFWQFTDNWVSNSIVRGTTYDNPDNNTVPEVDYRPTLKLGDMKKGGELTISTSPLLFILKMSNLL